MCDYSKVCLQNEICVKTQQEGGKKMSEKICSSADKPLEEFLKNCGEDTSHHRMVAQQNKCGFGLKGVCCRLCSNGPCRLSPAKPKGVCGADADTIACRNFLRQVAAGSGCYTHVVENTAKRLKELALDYKKQNKKLRNKDSLAKLAKMLDIACKGNCGKCGCQCVDSAVIVADAVLEDLRRPIEEKMELLEKIALPKRYETWKKLGILPGGAKDEIFNAVVKTSTNLNSDPMDMLLQCLRLGISTGNYGLILTNLMNDIIMSPPKITMDPVGLRIIDPEYINIMIAGHQQSMFVDLQEKLETEVIQKTAELVGAKGIRLVGCTCVGQDYQCRSSAYKDTYCGHAGNNYTSEAVLMTGCVDLVVSEFNCTIPGIEPICEKLDIPMICLDDVAKKVNARLLPYSDEKKAEITGEIISAALCGFKNRKEKLCGVCPKADEKRVNPMASHGYAQSLTGVSEDTLVAALGGSLQPLIDVLASGKIKGIAAVVGCSNLRAKGHDVFTVELTKKLIKKDILVLSAGCTCGGLENCGLMTMDAIELCGLGLKEVCTALGVPPVLNFGPCLAIGRVEMVACALAKELDVDLPQLPVVVSAPQWLEEQALADGAYALALGLPLHLGLAPFVTGSETAVKVLTEDLKKLTGGQLIIETEIDAAADKFEEIILEKRKGLGLV